MGTRMTSCEAGLRGLLVIALMIVGAVIYARETFWKSNPRAESGFSDSEVAFFAARFGLSPDDTLIRAGVGCAPFAHEDKEIFSQNLNTMGWPETTFPDYARDVCQPVNDKLVALWKAVSAKEADAERAARLSRIEAVKRLMDNQK